MTRTGLALSVESIQFQSARFFNQLTLAFGNLRELNAADRGKAKGQSMIETIQSAIKDFTGFKIAFTLAEWGPAIEVPTLDRNHPFLSPDVRKWVNRADGLVLLSHANEAVKGTVNLQTGKVTGVFTDRIYTLFFPTEMLSTRYTDGECAAGVLHEIGHLFTYCEYAARTVSTNQVLAGMAKALDKSETVQEREIVLRKVKDVLRLQELDPVQLAHVTDDKAVETVVLTNIVQQSRAEIGSNIYDMTTWEALADQYASRQGAGADLVTALYKLNKGTLAQRSAVGYYALEGLKLGLFAASVFFLPLAIVPLIMVIADSHDLTYDTPEVRYKRIRNQLVEALKAKTIPAPDKKAYLDDLAAVDAVLETVKDREQFFGWLYNLVSFKYRKRVSDVELAQELESYASNNFFVEALKLSHLADTHA